MASAASPPDVWTASGFRSCTFFGSSDLPSVSLIGKPFHGSFTDLHTANGCSTTARHKVVQRSQTAGIAERVIANTFRFLQAARTLAVLATSSPASHSSSPFASLPSPPGTVTFAASLHHPTSFRCHFDYFFFPSSFSYFTDSVCGGLILTTSSEVLAARPFVLLSAALFLFTLFGRPLFSLLRL